MSIDFSIIIVNYNCKSTLPDCLAALRSQTNPNFEVIIVDNASSDGSLELIDDTGLDMKIIKLNKNYGFAPANNRGATIASGQWLLLLNPDAFPEPDWVERLMAASKRHSECDFFASRQIQYRNLHILDGTGDIYAKNGRAWRRDYGSPIEMGEQSEGEVFGACAASAMINRLAFNQVGGFDEDYFCYFEDVDLCIRLRLAGFRCMYIPDAIVKHKGSASSGGEHSAFSVYYGYRNLVWTFFKTMPFPLIFKYLLKHLYLNYRQFTDFKPLGLHKVVLASKINALKSLPYILKKRAAIQKSKRISAKAFDQMLSDDLHY